MVVEPLATLMASGKLQTLFPPYPLDLLVVEADAAAKTVSHARHPCKMIEPAKRRDRRHSDKETLIGSDKFTKPLFYLRLILSLYKACRPRQADVIVGCC
jgi:hypothetical protein